LYSSLLEGYAGQLTHIPAWNIHQSHTPHPEFSVWRAHIIY